MADISNINLPNGENYDIKDKVARNDIALNRTTLGTQCKNLLKNTAVTTTVNNVTFTVNSDGSITAKQTTTASGNATIAVATNITLSPGTYILTGDDEIKKSGYGDIRFYINGTIYAANTAHTFDTEVTISSVRIFIWSGVNINGSKTIYPMLRYADITDSTYEPYKESVDERLIKNKSDIAINRTTLGTQCKNLLKNTAITKTVSGITFTVNADKSITVNGTNSTSNYVNIIVFKDELEAGTYILSGAVSDVFRIRLGVGASADGYGTWAGVDTGNGYKFTVTKKALYTVTCQVESGKTASNVIFKPMLRYADIIDSTFEPYKPSLQEQISALEARIAALGG